MNASAAEFAELLQGFGVDMGEPMRRLEKGRTMAEAGISLADAELAFCQVERTEDARHVPAIVARIAMSAERLRHACADARAHASRRAHAPGDTKADPATPPAGYDSERYRQDRLARAAYCRVVADRAPAAMVARELNIAPHELDALIERGRELSAPAVPTGSTHLNPAAAVKAEQESRARSQDFRERMRQDARRRKSGTGKRQLDWKRMEREMALLLAHVREHGVIDIASTIGDRERLGALATLEADGWILRTGEPDHRHRQPYRVARDEAERAEFRALLRAYNEKDVLRPRTARAAEAST